MRKTAIALSFLLLIVAFDKSGRGACPRSITLAVHVQKNARFDPDGSFWVHETPPNEFSELSAINLNAKKLRRLPSPGLQITDGTNYRFKTLIVRRNDFRFTTVALKNVSYTFSGRFLKGGNFAATALNDEVPVMEGTLARFVGGKKVAEAKIQFVYFGGT